MLATVTLLASLVTDSAATNGVTPTFDPWIGVAGANGEHKLSRELRRPQYLGSIFQKEAVHVAPRTTTARI
jgi:hypothetical protein